MEGVWLKFLIISSLNSKTIKGSLYPLLLPNDTIKGDFIITQTLPKALLIKILNLN